MLSLLVGSVIRATRHARSRRGQRGTITVEKLIVIGLIVVPLVIVLIMFKDHIAEWFHKVVDDLTQKDKDAFDEGQAFDD